MNRMQKMAWSMVIATLLGVVASAVAVALLYAKVGMPKALAGLAGMSLAGLGGLSPLIFRKDRGNITFDERDRLIKRRAALAGFGTAYMLVGLACMIPFFILGPKATISVRWLPLIFMGAGMSHFFAFSVAIVVQYGRADKSHAE